MQPLPHRLLKISICCRPIPYMLSLAGVQSAYTCFAVEDVVQTVPEIVTCAAVIPNTALHSLPNTTVLAELDCRQARQELKALKEQEAMFADEGSHVVNGSAEGLL